MKAKVFKRVNYICLLILTCILLVFIGGCYKKGEYKFIHDTDEIVAVKIIRKHDDPNASDYLEHFDTVLEIKDTEAFITDFRKIVYLGRVIGTLPHMGSGDYAILFEYSNGDYEGVGSWAQFKLKNGKKYSGRYYCDKDVFNEFIEKWLSKEQVKSE